MVVESSTVMENKNVACHEADTAMAGYWSHIMYVAGRQGASRSVQLAVGTVGSRNSHFDVDIPVVSRSSKQPPDGRYHILSLLWCSGHSPLLIERVFAVTTQGTGYIWPIALVHSHRNSVTSRSCFIPK